ncbi:MAG: YbhN family protein [bacterium]|nr:YbhN family protein [bacterium]
MRYLRYLFVVILIVVAFSLVSSKFRSSYHDIPALFNEARKELFLILILAEGVFYLTYGLLSKTLLEIAGTRISLKETVKVGALITLGFQVAPFVGGAVLAYLFYKKHKISSSTFLFLATVSSILNLLNYIIFSFVSIILVRRSFPSLVPQKEILSILIAVIFVLLSGYFLFRNRAKNLILLLCLAAKPIDKIGGVFAKRELLGQEKIKGIIGELLRDLGLVLQSRAKAVRVLVFSLLLYTVNLSVIYFSFFVFGYRPSIPLLILGVILSYLLSALSLFPEAPGVMEASMVTVFISLGFPAHVSLFSVLLYRLVSYWLPMPFGLLVYLNLNGHLPKGRKDLFENGETP